MVDFPLMPYIQAHAQKYQNEKEAQLPSWGAVLGSAIGGGVNKYFENKITEDKLTDQRKYELIKQYLSGKQVEKHVDGEWIVGDTDDAIQNINLLIKGQAAMKPDKKGHILMGDKKGNALGFRWVDKSTYTQQGQYTDVVIDDSNIETLKKFLPGYDLKLGSAVKVPNTTYNTILGQMNKPNKSLEDIEAESAAKARGYSSEWVQYIEAGEEPVFKNVVTGEVSPTIPQGSKFKTSAIPISPAMRDRTVRAEKLSEMYKVIDFFEKKINEIPGGKGLAGRVKGLEVKAGAFLQTNPKAAAYISSLEGLRSQIARGLGEVGNLAEHEQEYAINLLPQITDNLETRQARLQNFKDYIATKLGNMPQGQAIAVAGAEQEAQPQPAVQGMQNISDDELLKLLEQ